MSWEDIINDKDFQQQPMQIKMDVAKNYFDKNFASDPEFQKQPDEVKLKVSNNFLSTLDRKPFFQRLLSVPNEAVGETQGFSFPGVDPISNKAIAQTIVNAPRPFVKGVTMGASESLRKKLTSNDPEPYGNLDPISRTVGEFAGAAVPVGYIGKGVGLAVKGAKPLVGAAGASKWFDPVAKSVAWGVGGAGYTTAETLIEKGELPSPKELGTSAGLWAGTEAVINSLGWAGRLAMSVNRIAKISGISKAEALKGVLNEAKEIGLPIGKTAKKLNSDIDAQKAMDDYLIKLENETAIAYENAAKEQVGEQGVRGIADRHASFPTGVPTEVARQKRKVQIDAINKEQDISGQTVGNVEVTPQLEQKIKEEIDLDRYLMRESETVGLMKDQGSTGVTEDIARQKVKLQQDALNKGKVSAERESVGAQGTMLEERGRIVSEQRKDPLEIKKGEESLIERTGIASEQYRSSVQNIYSALKGKIPTWDEDLLIKLASKEPIYWDASDKVIYNDMMKKYGKGQVPMLDPKTEIGEGYNIRPEQEATNRREWKKKAKGAFIQSEIDSRKKIQMYGENPNNVTPDEFKNMPWQEVSKKLGYDDRAIKNWQKRLDVVKEGEKLGIPLDEIQNYENQVIGGIKKNQTQYQTLSGVISGIETDEDGNITYDPIKGIAGMAVGAAWFAKKKPKAQLSPAAERVSATYEKNEIAIRQREQVTAKKIKDAFVRGVVDVQGKAKNMLLAANPELGEKARQRLVASAGSNAEASRLNDLHHDKIYKGLSVPEEHALDHYIMSKRFLEIERYKPGEKITGGRTPQEHEAYLNELPIKFGLSDAQMNNIKAKGDAYFNAHKELLNQRLAEGLISKESYKEMEGLLYSPKKYLQHLSDMEEIVTGRPLSVKESGVKSLAGGSEEFLETRSKLLLQQSTSTVQDIIYKNKAAKSLLDIAKANSENGLVREAKIVGKNKNGTPIYEDAKATEKKLFAMVEGQRVEMIVPKEFAESWVKSDPLINQTTAEWIQWVGGAKMIKATATGYNPLFILTNMSRDIGLVWSGQQYSRAMPLAAAQFTKDFASTAKDVFTNKGRVIEYIQEGGGMDFLTYYGRFKGEGHVGEKINTLSNLLGWIGGKSELWTRIAHRDRAIKNLNTKFEKKNNRPPNALEQKAIQEEATIIAREGSIDFSQGGNVVKAIDNALPYFNAGVQGTRVFWRNYKTDPVGVTIKMAQLGALGAGVYHWNKDHPGINQVSEREKAQNFILMVPDILPGVTSYEK
jgi:hypothetical protein